MPVLSKKPLFATKQRIVILSKIRLGCQVNEADWLSEIFHSKIGKPNLTLNPIFFLFALRQNERGMFLSQLVVF